MAAADRCETESGIEVKLEYTAADAPRELMQGHGEGHVQRGCQRVEKDPKSSHLERSLATRAAFASPLGTC